MLREQVTAPVLPPCVVCAAESASGFWEAHLCESCWGRWCDEAGPQRPLELAHADAHPEDVLERGEYKYRDSARGDDHRWVILKPGVGERLAREFAREWVRGARKRVAA